MQKYLKITQEYFVMLAKFHIGCEIDFPQFWFRKAYEIHFPQFRKACKISHRVRNSFSKVLLSILQLVLLLAFRKACENFAQPCEIVGCQISSLIFFLAYLIDLAKATKLSKAWILHVFELQLALPWTIHNSPSFLARLNDQKAIKNTKTCQKLIGNICKGL